jgi:hypothetical protein
MRDPGADVSKLVRDAAASGKGAAELRAVALATSLRGAADLGKLQHAVVSFLELWGIGDDGSFGDLCYAKARAACMLMELYGDRLMYSELQEVFKAADELPNRRDVAAEKFRASVRIITSYAAGGELAAALSLYRPLEYLEGLGEFDLLRASAAGSLSAAFAEKGILAEARALYAVQADIFEEGALRAAAGAEAADGSFRTPAPGGQQPDDPLGILDAASDALACHERELFRFEEEAGLEEDMWTDRALAAVALMDGYAELGETDEAFAVHRELRLPDPSSLPPELKLSVVAGLLGACVKGGDLERAKEVFRVEALEMPPLDSLQEGRASMAGSMMSAMADRGDLDGARSVYDALEFPGDGPMAKQARSYLSGLMAKLLSVGGQPGKAARLLKSPRFRHDCQGFPLVSAKSSLELAEAYVRKGRLGEARDICESGDLELGAEGGVSGKAMAASSTINRLCLDGDIAAARQLFEKFPEGRRSRKSALYKVMASMSLRDAYCESGNAEGMEFICRCVKGFSALEAALFNRAVNPEEDG